MKLECYYKLVMSPSDGFHYLVSRRSSAFQEMCEKTVENLNNIPCRNIRRSKVDSCDFLKGNYIKNCHSSIADVTTWTRDYRRVDSFVKHGSTKPHKAFVCKKEALC